MNPRDLVSLVLAEDDIPARQFVKDAKREGFAWSQAPAPDFSDATHCAVYASLVELFAERNGETAPAWTRDVGKAPAPVFLMGKTPRLQKMYQEQSPPALKRRNVMASRDYLDVL